MMARQAVTLGDLAGRIERLEVRCTRCPRHGRVKLAKLLAEHGADLGIRAALAEQTLAGREIGLKYADKLVRSFAALTDALNRHRGKGQQVVRVEHVTVQAGGQAIAAAATSMTSTPLARAALGRPPAT